MKCFNHNNQDAIGTCKSCHKAICKECVIELPIGLVCSENCANKANAVNEVVELQIRQYQKLKKNKFNAYLLIFAIFSMTMWISPIEAYIKKSYVDYQDIIIPILFSAIAIILFIHHKRNIKILNNVD